jgi:putative aldouronate transport system permease protein
MYFNGGLIPSYLNVRELGLHNSHWALILPTVLSVYNAIICKTAIEGIPSSLSESAYLDGANDIQVLFRIIMPLIKPTLAVLVLYYGVGHWNSWFTASIYLEESELLPIQNILRAVLDTSEGGRTGSTGVTGMDGTDAFAEAVKYSAIVISTVPILCVYPFLQKHFAKGAMIGAVKG